MVEQWEYLDVQRYRARVSEPATVSWVNGESIYPPLDWSQYLTRLGNEGWELVAVDNGEFFFKRRKP